MLVCKRAMTCSSDQREGEGEVVSLGRREQPSAMAASRIKGVREGETYSPQRGYVGKDPSTYLGDDDQPGVNGDQLETLLERRLHLGIGAMIEPESEQTQDVLQGRGGMRGEGDRM